MSNKEISADNINLTGANKRYIPVGGEAQFERFTVSIKFVTAESEAISNAARNIPPPLGAKLRNTKPQNTNRKNLHTIETILHLNRKLLHTDELILHTDSI